MFAIYVYLLVMKTKFFARYNHQGYVFIFFPFASSLTFFLNLFLVILRLGDQI